MDEPVWCIICSIRMDSESEKHHLKDSHRKSLDELWGMLVPATNSLIYLCGNCVDFLNFLDEEEQAVVKNPHLKWRVCLAMLKLFHDVDIINSNDVFSEENGATQIAEWTK